ncbi:Methyltransferase domain-containing protein [Lentzea albidocapillata subsp. violacea]|uniref:Methyltransferase domain-containing protein n=1 Tax=Lentzea albidocapillata subsp. violacea TaxID=128104 RepID=A0A1G9XUS0_9PSEU|nr:Methyltransferase domain-containing protein [Lentzea albidocapillata subsp. violacea]
MPVVDEQRPSYVGGSAAGVRRLHEAVAAFLQDGTLPSAGCAAVRTVPSTDLYRDDTTFAAFSVQQQIAPNTDDGARRTALCHHELALFGREDLGRVLDLMCGVGGHLVALKSSGLRWKSYLGVDVNPLALDVARRAAGADAPARFVKADVRDWVPGEGTADTVLLTYEALNTAGREQATRLLTTVATALSPGGSALIDLSVGTSTATAGRDAQVLPDGSTAVLTSVEDTGSDSTQQVLVHTTHFMNADGCRLHFSHPWWVPSPGLLRSLFLDTGLEICSEHQVHAFTDSDKPSTANAVQFVVVRN